MPGTIFRSFQDFGSPCVRDEIREEQGLTDKEAKARKEYVPWIVIPVDNKWPMRSNISQMITETINPLDMQYPETTPERKILLDYALVQLLAEKD